MKRALCWILLLLMALPMTGQAQEEILSFNSSIQVNTDGSILVEETIQVRAEGDAIQRGIYRYFPTEYTDQLGNHYRVDFKLMEVLKDSVSEPYRIVPQDNGVRVYIGNSNVYLGQGVYSYTLRYSTYWQLGFFEKHDELYWNVTGNQWNFPILQTSARVELPVAVPTNSISVEGYTGVQGSQGSDYVAEVSSGTARYKATRTLKAGEGLTIVVSWPKGFITEPTEEQHMARLLKDNQSILVAAAGVALLLFYYLAIWYRLGRDPEGGVVIPHYMPPKGFSPASMRFIRRMDYDEQTFATAIVNMAVAGYLRIEENSKKTFSLHKTGALPKLATGEGAIGSALFGGGNNSIELTQKNYRNISKAVRVHKNALKRDYEKLYFVTNRLTILPGVLLSIGLILACVLSIPSVDERVITGFLAFWLSVWSAGVYMLVKNALGNWMAISTEEGSIGGAIFSTLFAVPFICGEVLGLVLIVTQGSPLLILVLGMAVGVNIVFYKWMKAPTLAGRKLLDRIEGFALYLSVAEKDELQFKHPPEKTPELFERYLPFAIALDVEEHWGGRFSSVIDQANAMGFSLAPKWYSGSSWNQRKLNRFGSAMSHSMSSAIASSKSATRPGSSSGSSGGGFSGGGGGGGGGGGW